MPGTDNPLAAGLAAAPLGGTVRRAMWELGGRRVYERHPAPISAEELKALPVGEAATAAANLDDPAVLAAVWQSDGRANVARAVLSNPHVPAHTALAGILWLLERREQVPYQLAARAGLDSVVELFDAHPATSDSMYGPRFDTQVEVVSGSLADWAAGLGVDRLLELAHRAWAAEIVSWVMVHGPDSGFVTEDSVDELWTRASVPARRFAFRRLTHDIGFSRRWLQRLDGHGSLCRTTPFPGPTDPLPDPLPVADPDLPTEGWEANVAAVVAERGAAAVTESVAATLLERHTVPARLRLGLARTAGKAKGLCEGRFSQNPTEPAVFDDPSFWAEGEPLDDGRRTELQVLLRNQCADLALRARAAVRLGGEGSGVTSVAELGPLDGDLMLALARATPWVAGRWLAGRLEHNPVGDVRSALDALDDLPDDTKVGIAEAYAVNLHGEPDSAVLEWVAAVPGVLARTNQVPLMVLVARVAQQRLGDDLDAWQLFAELGAGSPSPVRDVLEVVIAAGDAAG